MKVFVGEKQGRDERKIADEAQTRPAAVPARLGARPMPWWQLAQRLTQEELASVQLEHRPELEQEGKEACAVDGRLIAVARPEVVDNPRVMAHEVAHIVQQRGGAQLNPKGAEGSAGAVQAHESPNAQKGEVSEARHESASVAGASDAPAQRCEGLARANECKQGPSGAAADAQAGSTQLAASPADTGQTGQTSQAAQPGEKTVDFESEADAAAELFLGGAVPKGGLQLSAAAQGLMYGGEPEGEIEAEFESDPALRKDADYDTKHGLLEGIRQSIDESAAEAAAKLLAATASDEERCAFVFAPENNALHLLGHFDSETFGRLLVAMSAEQFAQVPVALLPTASASLYWSTLECSLPETQEMVFAGWSETSWLCLPPVDSLSEALFRRLDAYFFAHQSVLPGGGFSGTVSQRLEPKFKERRAALIAADQANLDVAEAVSPGDVFSPDEMDRVKELKEKSVRSAVGALLDLMQDRMVHRSGSEVAGSRDEQGRIRSTCSLSSRLLVEALMGMAIEARIELSPKTSHRMI
ncbi:MAG: hypothetical protein RBU37_27340, partial [Myxococcota bacterium]|nr:hypothetical protein [Myxococcota bacterium]